MNIEAKACHTLFNLFAGKARIYQHSCICITDVVRISIAARVK